MLRLIHIGAWLLLLIACNAKPVHSSQRSQNNVEKLFIRQLPQGRTLAYFEFVSTWDTHSIAFDQTSNVHHYGLFPKSLAEVIRHYRAQEVHLTLTQGMWRDRVWGYPPISAPLGAELWAWFLPDAVAEQQWKGLVNAMSGLLCASLNFIDTTTTYQPLHSFKPWGAIFGNISASQLRYASLPREAVCTENFTPWTKLLPCGSKAGLGALMAPSRLYDAEYHSLGVHFTYECHNNNCSQIGLQLLQTLTVVFRPPSSKTEWTIQSLFSKSLTSSCPLASVSTVYVCITQDLLNVTEPTGWENMELGGTVTRWAVFDVANLTSGGAKFQLSAHLQTSTGMPWAPSVHVHRFITGGKREHRGITTEVSNNQLMMSEVLYLTMLPWFCRPYLHTLKVTQGSLLYQHYIPAKDRTRPHTLELLIRVPPLSTITISIQFSPAFLKWTEHPPDAHHGFYINSAVATTVMTSCPNCTIPVSLGTRHREVMVRLHTEPLLVPLPTPDFSMPYNVLCLVCTVVAIGFGSIFNLTTRQLVPDIAAQKKGYVIFGKTVDRSLLSRGVLLLGILGVAAYAYLNPQ